LRPFLSYQGADHVIGYRAIDLFHVVPGEDRWQYEYQVTHSAFHCASAFDIFATGLMGRGRIKAEISGRE
jgi:hypothetical protein